MIRPQNPLSVGEFVVLMALMTSFVALSIDAMLPALGVISEDLGSGDQNDRQLVVSVLFLGMAIGQFFYGPVSDSIGRKPVVMFGVSIFAMGCLVSALAESYPTMLIGRFLQGIGAAAPRNVTVALIRDCYRGDAMGQIMSLIMAVFIIVPMVAPAIGQVILWVADWPTIFYVLLTLGLLAQAWFSLRQPETLAPEERRNFSLESMWRALKEVCTNRLTLGCTLGASLIFGAFVGYLTSSQQIFQDQYGKGDLFVFYFAIIAASLGLASLVNSRLVMRFGMRYLTRIALVSLSILSLVFLAMVFAYDGHPPFALLLGFLLIAFFPIGVMFGNLNGLAMEPMGHIAGMAAAVVGSIMTMVSLFLGSFIGRAYDGTVIPLVTGFAVLSSCALMVLFWALRDDDRTV